MTQDKLNVVVLMGGPSAEHDVSLNTGKVIINALNRSKYNILPVTISKEGKWFLPALGELPPGESDKSLSLETGKALENLKSSGKADVVFIAMHGTWGEDGTVQGFLELAGIPYTGSGILASALAMDKSRSCRFFSSYGLQVPAFMDISRREWAVFKDRIMREIADKLAFPCVIKPSACGSSVGISIVKNMESLELAIEEAFIHDRTVMAQEFVSGVEVTCAVLDEGEKDPVALPPTQIIPKGSEFFDYHAKYSPGASEEVTPPRLPSETIEKIQQIALKAHEALGCYGMSRTDMIVSERGIFVLETNTIPGMTETSLFPQAAAAVGISFAELLDKMISSALKGDK
jgi:D-alanine-D-alanine ligase